MTAFLTATDLQQELNQRGITVQLRGANLMISPKGAAGDLLPEVARFKSSLVEILKEEDDNRCRERFPQHLRVHFPDADQIAIGRNLLALDRGEDIEEDY